MSYYPKTAILPPCSIHRHGGHDGWSAGSSDINFKGNPLRMIQAKFGLNWPSGFRGEDFLKSLQTDDGRQVMAIAHMILWVRWAKKLVYLNTKVCRVCHRCFRVLQQSQQQYMYSNGDVNIVVCKLTVLIQYLYIKYNLWESPITEQYSMKSVNRQNQSSI